MNKWFTVVLSTNPTKLSRSYDQIVEFDLDQRRHQMYLPKKEQTCRFVKDRLWFE